MEEKAKNTPKKKKKSFVSMEIAKVPLDPQQAVFSCCDQAERGVVQPTIQCEGGGICGMGEEVSVAS